MVLGIIEKPVLKQEIQELRNPKNATYNENTSDESPATICVPAKFKVATNHDLGNMLIKTLGGEKFSVFLEGDADSVSRNLLVTWC